MANVYRLAIQTSLFPLVSQSEDEVLTTLLLTYYFAGTPDYPYIAEVQSYLESYCDHFGLSKHIRLSQSVIGATPVGNITGWQLKIMDKNGEQREE